MTAHEISDFFKERGIILPQDFEKTFDKNCEVNPNLYFSIEKAKKILDMCNLWRNCIVSEKSFAQLISNKIISQIRIGCAVISTNKETRAYVGKHGVEIDDYKLPPPQVTILQSNGNLLVLKNYPETNH